MERLKSMCIERLRQALRYDPETGVFYYNERRGCYRPGDVAGYSDSLGYRYVRVDGRVFPMTRLAWALMTGEFPDALVDHINRVPSDDRWVNLRLASRRQNMMNTKLRKDNSTGHKGVVKHPNGKYRAGLHVEGKRVHLGYFSTLEEAAQAYMDAARRYYGDYATDGKGD